MNSTTPTIKEVASLIRGARYLTAFTGAGISVESGIPPFRGEGGLWNKYDPRLLELDYFLRHPEVSWPILREIFYDHFGKAKPNKAHEMLARLENEGWAQEGAPGGRTHLKILITQNIDSMDGIDEGRSLIFCRARLRFSDSAEQTTKNSSSQNVLCYFDLPFVQAERTLPGRSRGDPIDRALT